MRSSPGKNKVIAFWLIPAKAEQELFSELIRILAAQLDAPRFEAHLTICAVPDTRLAREALGQISVPPIRLQVLRLHVSNRFTKTLFVRFRRKRALDDLNASLRRTAQLPAGAVRDPHVSLLYKKMPMAAKRELASTIHLPLDEVAFDSMKARGAWSRPNCSAISCRVGSANRAPSLGRLQAIVPTCNLRSANEDKNFWPARRGDNKANRNLCKDRWRARGAVRRRS